jgi:hypothetical protein
LMLWLVRLLEINTPWRCISNGLIEYYY